MIIACDIDGTLFNNEHRAEFIPQDKSNTDNWRKFNELHIYDKPIRHRIHCLNFLAMQPDNEVVYISSRSEEFLEETKAQLNLARAPVGRFLLRDKDDHRSAAEVKVDFLRHIIGSEPFALIDDDLSVCHAVANEFPNAVIINVPSQDCAYLAQAMEVV